MNDLQSLIDNGRNRFQAGDIEGAAASFTKALTVAPSASGARMGLAACLVRAGRINEAKAQLEGVPDSDPGALDALNELGTLCLQTKDMAGAERAFLKIRPRLRDNIPVLGNLCLALLALGKFKETLRELKDSEALIAQQPKLLEFGAAAAVRLSNMPLALQYYRQILSLEPNNKKALEGILNSSPDPAERKAVGARLLADIRGSGGDAERWKALALAAYNEDGYEAAREIYDEGISRTGDAGLLMLRALLLPKVPLSHAQMADARAEMHTALDRLIAGDYKIEKLAKSVGKLPFHLCYHGENDKALQEKIARAHLKVSPHLSWTSPHLAGARQKRSRIRIGFISANLTFHSVGRMFGGFVQHLDSVRFEKIIIRPVGRLDDFAENLNRSVEQSVVLPPDLADARKAIAALDLDILFYADIGMDPFTYYLAFSRLAPIQMAWPGHPITSGLSTIDYAVTSSILEAADCRDHYSEEPILLSLFPSYFERETADVSHVDRASLGLPEGAPLYVCPMTLYKFHPDFDAIIAKILARDPAGKLVMVAQDTFWYRGVLERMGRAVPDLQSRLITLPWLQKKQFLGLMRLADVIVDTVHMCGANTSLDAFSYGTPMVTRLDRFLRGRWTAAMYAQMDYTDLVAKTDDEYVDLAVRVANDRELRESASETILSRNGTLYSNIAVVTDLGERLMACKQRSV
jgi:predicted O-linked N-acetylglucosamine transferase (SPINDLY family)